jgi:all-trans-retinol dehydrogenase (NAD+)
MSQIAGANILITGGASGIGRLVALKLGALGSRTILWDIDDARLEAVAQEFRNLGYPVFPYHCDVSSRGEVSAVAEAVKRDAGKVDILINNAGVVTGKFCLDCSEEEIEKTMAVNLMANFWTVRAFLSDMIKTGSGHIVTVASAAGIIGVSQMVDYCTSKFAAFGFDEALRMEIRKRKWKVRTTVVCPYFINTEMFQGVKTRFSWLLPILDVDKVTEKIVEAIQKNKKRLILPPVVYSVWLLRLFPVAVFDFAANLLGINTAMTTYKGRTDASRR